LWNPLLFQTVKQYHHVFHILIWFGTHIQPFNLDKKTGLPYLVSM